MIAHLLVLPRVALGKCYLGRCKTSSIHSSPLSPHSYPTDTSLLSVLPEPALEAVLVPDHEASSGIWVHGLVRLF